MRQKILGLLIIFLFIAWAIPAIAGINSELYYPPPYKSKNYVVQKNDCLSLIAFRFYGDINKWPLIHKMNPWIKDPNYIDIGWTIAVAKAEISKEEYLEWVRADLKKKVFKICRIKYISKKVLLEELSRQFSIFSPTLLSTLSPHYFSSLVEDIRPLLRALELHDIVDCIVDVGADNEWHDIYYLLTAVAWKETSFKNRDGLHGEKGYWQWRVNTALLLCPEMTKGTLLHLLEFDTYFATNLTYDHLTAMAEERGSWRKALIGYNGSGDSARQYAAQVITKFHKLKRMK